ncbi:MAG: four helix bundle protein [Chitinophagales bacterium]|nr:four helix bundle protein [Chitinophagales bacterium]
MTDLKSRTKIFAIDIIRFVQSLENNPTNWIIGKQLLRCGTSVGANYRAACRAKSDIDFKYKIKIVEEEIDETEYWKELLIESETISEARVQNLLKETKELTAIFSAISIKLKNKKNYIMKSYPDNNMPHLVLLTSYLVLPTSNFVL